MDCLVYRKQEWRIGDVNTAIVGPRDQWRQYTWGNAERCSLFVDGSSPLVEPALTPSIRERIQAKDSKGKQLGIERDAKFIQVCAAGRLACTIWSIPANGLYIVCEQVASGKYHTLLLSGSYADISVWLARGL